jgi:hypothetical protein
VRALVVVLALAAGIAGGASAGTSTRTALTVTYWAGGQGAGTSATWTLRCSPARGSLPHPAAACARLATRGPRIFAPVARDAVCTQTYGGPQVALVVGVVGGQRVWARLQRRNGCEIERWSRVSPWLLPTGGTG